MCFLGHTPPLTFTCLWKPVLHVPLPQFLVPIVSALLGLIMAQVCLVFSPLQDSFFAPQWAVLEASVLGIHLSLTCGGKAEWSGTLDGGEHQLTA